MCLHPQERPETQQNNTQEIRKLFEKPQIIYTLFKVYQQFKVKFYIVKQI